MTKSRNAPEDNSAVTIPAGSFDHEALQRGLDAAATAKPEDRGAALSKALDDGAAAPAGSPDQHTTPGYRFEEVSRELAPGVNVTERIQVPDVEVATSVPETPFTATQAG